MSVPPSKTCPVCANIAASNARQCMRCGYRYPGVPWAALLTLLLAFLVFAGIIAAGVWHQYQEARNNTVIVP